MPPNATGDAIPDETTPLINNDVESGVNTSSRDDNDTIEVIGEEDKPRKFLCITASNSTLKQSFGIGLVVMAGILFTVSNVIQKKFISVDQWHLLFFRAVIQMSTMSGFVLYMRVSPFGSTWKDTGAKPHVKPDLCLGILGTRWVMRMFLPRTSNVGRVRPQDK